MLFHFSTQTTTIKYNIDDYHKHIEGIDITFCYETIQNTLRCKIEKNIFFYIVSILHTLLAPKVRFGKPIAW